MSPFFPLVQKLRKAGVYSFDFTIAEGDFVTTDKIAADLSRLLSTTESRAFKSSPGASITSFSSKVFLSYSLKKASAWNSVFELQSAIQSQYHSTDDLISVDVLLAAVSGFTGLEIEVHQSDISTTAVSGILGVTERGTADIILSGDLPSAWKRFVVAKELAHLLIPETSQNVDLQKQIESLILPPAAVSPEVVQQGFAQLLAIELLYPAFLRDAHQKQLRTGLMSIPQIASSVGLPEVIIRFSHQPFLIEHAFMARACWVAGRERRSWINLQSPTSEESRNDLISDLVELAGPVCTVDDAASLLETSPHEVWSRVAAGQLFAIARGGTIVVPKAQIDVPNKRVEPSVSRILSAFQDRTPLEILQFLVTPDSSLDHLSPLNALKRGDEWSRRAERLADAHQGDGFA